ncbi:hypothetical protein [Streptomyces sp. NBC_00259]|uniref:hypothetical protein n=1 Tax=Streptomyces sp. NBC_00259 TaxID=2903643 RepID=UPI002E2DDC8A|nr:hypothetical protein [Streptomyces sp. NBC_00259]
MRGRQRYARTVRRAVATVPHYRERYAATGTLPPLTRDEAELRRHLLMPLGSALLARRDPGRPAGEHIAELHEALRLAGHRTDGGRDVYEIASALRDPVRAYGTNWRVLLATTADAGRYAERYAERSGTDRSGTERSGTERSGAERPGTGRPVPDGHALVVGDAGQLAGVAAGPVTVERVTLAAAARTRPAAGSVWYEPWLGHLGGVPGACGELHLNPSRVHARLLDGETVLTLLRRRRPTLVHVRPEGAEFFGPGRCPLHGVPILRRPL